MTQEPTSGPKGNQAGKSASSRRSRANRNRPVLISSTTDTFETGDQPVENGNAADQLVTPVETNVTDGTGNANQTTEPAATNASRGRRLPKFFSTVGRTEQKETAQPVVDPAQARIARATAGKTKAQTSESKQAVASAPVKNTAARSTPARSASSRPPSAFKMRYIVGMLAYLLIADLIGTFETSYLTANHLNYTLFSLGSFPVTLSTALFLLTLVVVLIVLARFDLIPRNLAGLGGQQSAQRKTGSTGGSSDAGGTKTPPAMKQGVKGADDDLYQEYRAQQRYNQRRERKR
jgi:hypothetical protein